MVVTLYGSPITTCTKRVLVVMKELDLPYNFVPIDVFKGEHKSKEFLEKQPFGQVPYIVRINCARLFGSLINLSALYL